MFVCGAWEICCCNWDAKRASDSKTEHGSDDEGTVGVWLDGAVDELINESGGWYHVFFL